MESLSIGPLILWTPSYRTYLTLCIYYVGMYVHMYIYTHVYVYIPHVPCLVHTLPCCLVQPALVTTQQRPHNDNPAVSTLITSIMDGFVTPSSQTRSGWPGLSATGIWGRFLTTPWSAQQDKCQRSNRAPRRHS
jgi:hypothetical protein